MDSRKLRDRENLLIRVEFLCLSSLSLFIKIFVVLVLKEEREMLGVFGIDALFVHLVFKLDFILFLLVDFNFKLLLLSLDEVVEGSTFELKTLTLLRKDLHEIVSEREDGSVAFRKELKESNALLLYFNHLKPMHPI
jgi:hypothetical protein